MFQELKEVTLISPGNTNVLGVGEWDYIYIEKVEESGQVA